MPFVGRAPAKVLTTTPQIIETGYIVSWRLDVVTRFQQHLLISLTFELHDIKAVTRFIEMWPEDDGMTPEIRNQCMELII